MSNILALPLVQIAVQTGTYEDWIDTIKYIAPTTADDPDPPQVDLRGIEFEMEVRRGAADHEVVLAATTKDGSLSIGLPPDYGYLLFYIKSEIMKKIIAGSYIADVVGRDELYARKVIEIDLTIVEGVTKWQSSA